MEVRGGRQDLARTRVLGQNKMLPGKPEQYLHNTLWKRRNVYAYELHLIMVFTDRVCGDG
jgi:hypothetical protein